MATGEAGEFQPDWFSDKYLDPTEAANQLQQLQNLYNDRGVDAIYGALLNTAISETGYGEVVKLGSIAFIDRFATKYTGSPKETRVSIRKAAATGAIMGLHLYRAQLQGADIDLHGCIISTIESISSEGGARWSPKEEDLQSSRDPVGVVAEGIRLLDQQACTTAEALLSALVPCIESSVPPEDMNAYARAGLGFMLFVANEALKQHDAKRLAAKASGYNWDALLLPPEDA